MNVRDCFDIAIARESKKRHEAEERERQVFFNKCLREINGGDAYEYLVYKASKILKCQKEEAVYRIVNYYFDNQEHFDCSFTEWLTADNGPLVRSGIKGLFPEFEVITSDDYEIAQLAKDKYDIDIRFENSGYQVYCLEFSFKDINSKRVDMKKVKEAMKAMIEEVL